MGFASSGFHKEKGKSHNITPGGCERKRKSHITSEAPIVFSTKPKHIRCLQIPPTPPHASKRIAESLHRKIQIVSRAVRLLEHKLRGEALLSVSNILSIIHKEEGKIKRCWLPLKNILDCVADTAVTYGLMLCFLSPEIVRNIYPQGCIHRARHCTDMNKTDDKNNNISLSDLLPAREN